MSRLLTTLLLYQSGFQVGKYISLENKIAKNKDLYYDALVSSQIDWHEGSDDPEPFIKYFLSIVMSAYRDFEDRIDIVSEKSNATDMVELATTKILGKFKKADVLNLCPSLSASSVEKAIKELVGKGKLSKYGNGKSTFYTRNF